MKIVQVNTRDVRGGAARAAYRLHQALQQAQQDCRMVVRWKTIDDNSVIEVTHQQLELEHDAPTWQSIQQRYINRNLSSQARTIFSLAYPGFDLTGLEAIAQADIIHLHWVALFLSPTSLQKLLALGKPVVWTFHDMWPFTGGCHYASGCQGYTQTCAACPQLRDDPFNLPQAVLQDRIQLLSGYDNLTVVTPSQWLASVVRQSTLFGDHRVEVIPNPIETDLYQPLEKSHARKLLGVPPHAFTVVAQSSSESRKEFPQLVAAIQQALQDPRMRAAVDAGQLHFLFFGGHSDLLETLDFPFTYVGWSHQTSKLAEFYSAGDMFILPSLEDNLPNVMLESISCGTPILAFDVGGMPDVVQPQKTGWLVPAGDFDQLAKTLVEAVLNPDACYRMQPLCRQVAETQYGMGVIAQRFLALYEDLLHAAPARNLSGSGPGQMDEYRVNAVGAGEAIAATATLSPPIGVSQEPELSLADFEGNIGSHTAAVYESVLMRTLLQASQEEVAMYGRLKQLEAEVADRDRTIEAMKTSKFWKLRGRWFKIKRRLGLPDNE